MPTRDDYRIGWICALPVEMAAAQAMLDRVHPALHNRKNDRNKYVLGSIGPHNIVITCLPAGVYGTTPATATVLQMRYSYESVEVCFMVGIGGGVPGEHDVRLGDIVISEPTTRYGGVMQHDRGKALDGGRTTATGVLDKPPEAILRALLGLKAEHLLRGNNVRLLYNEAMQKYPHLHALAEHPGRDADQLFVAEYSHVLAAASCHECDPTMLQQRPPRPDDHPRIFYGLIASGNKVIKDARVRDQLAKQYGILCFETEAAGIMDIFPCLVIRGVCDYSDSHKNKRWQGYAAVVAAAYTKEFLLHLPSHDMVDTMARFEELTVDIPLPKSEGLTVAASNLSSFSIPGQSLPESNQENESESARSPPILDSNIVHPNGSGSSSSAALEHGSDEDCKHAIQLTEHECKLTPGSEAAAEVPVAVQPNIGKNHEGQETSSSALTRGSVEMKSAPPSLTRIPPGLASQINSQEIFQKTLVFSRARKLWHPWPGDCDAVYLWLKAWLSTTAFHGLIVRPDLGRTGMMIRDPRRRGFLAEVIAFLLQWKEENKEHSPEYDYRVVWALPSGAAASNDPVEDLKSIISDLLRSNTDVLSSDEIAEATHYTEGQLWLLLEKIHSRAKRTFVIFHTRNAAFTTRMLQFADDVIFPSGCPVKIMISVSEQASLHELSASWRTTNIPREPPISSRLRRRPAGDKQWGLLSPIF